MQLTPEQKELKKELAKYKRKVLELAGVVHDIVEDRIWDDYKDLAQLSILIESAMDELNMFKAKHEFFN